MWTRHYTLVYSENFRACYWRHYITTTEESFKRMNQLDKNEWERNCCWSMRNSEKDENTVSINVKHRVCFGMKDGLGKNQRILSEIIKHIANYQRKMAAKLAEP